MAIILPLNKTMVLHQPPLPPPIPKHLQTKHLVKESDSNIHLIARSEGFPTGCERTQIYTKLEKIIILKYINLLFQSPTKQSKPSQPQI